MEAREYRGEVAISYKPEAVIEFLRDPRRFAPCIPGVVRHYIDQDGSLRLRLRLDVGSAGIADISSITSDATIRISGYGDGYIIYNIEGRALGSSYSVELRILAKPVDRGSRVYWEARASLGALIRILSRFFDIDRLVEEIARKAVENLTRCIEASGLEDTPP